MQRPFDSAFTLKKRKRKSEVKKEEKKTQLSDLSSL